MFADLTPPAPPELPGCTWRALMPQDAPALHSLIHSLGRTNGLSYVESLEDYETYLNDPGRDAAQHSLGAFAADGRLLALAWVRRNDIVEDAWRFDLWTEVHPSLREQALEPFLLAWQEARARMLLSAVREPQPRSWLATYAEHDEQVRIAAYEAAAFTVAHSEQQMRYDLTTPLPAAPLPEGIILVPWTPLRDVLMWITFCRAFADRTQGQELKYEAWRRDYSGESTFYPDLSFIALEGNEGVGVTRVLLNDEENASLAEPRGEINHIAVRPEWRRRGIASAMMVAVLQGLVDRGLRWATLNVDVHNTPAIRSYERLGFVVAGGYSRYEKIIHEAG